MGREVFECLERMLMAKLLVAKIRDVIRPETTMGGVTPLYSPLTPSLLMIDLTFPKREPVAMEVVEPQPIEGALVCILDWRSFER